MTFGQMLKLTQRFNQILGGAQKLKNQRLKSLANDIEQAYAKHGLFNDVAAHHMHAAVCEEMEG